MLDSVQNSEDYVFKFVLWKLETTKSAMLNHVLNKLKKVLSKLWIGDSVIFNHLKGALAKPYHDLSQRW